MNYRIIGILSVLSLVTACGDNPLAPSEAIVVSWQIESVSNGGTPFSPVVYTFSNDGNLTFSSPLSDETSVTTYVIDGDQLTINGFIIGVDESGRELTAPTLNYRIKIEGSTLTMTDTDNSVAILRRV